MTQPSPPAKNVTAVPPVDAGDALATALGRIPSGLFIVTWREDGRDRGMLASWVMQAGFSPPMLTIAVAPGRDLLAAAAAGMPFVVNVLGETQRQLLAVFGKPARAGEDQFGGLAMGRAPCGAPTLDDAASWLECVPISTAAGGQTDPGDHVIVVARITVGAGRDDRTPLVHVRRTGLRY